MNRDYFWQERYSDQPGLGEFLLRSLAASVRVALPVEVLAVTRTGGVEDVGTVDVQPLIDQQDAQGIRVTHAPCYSLPYIRFQCGANAVIIDPQPGDIGLAVFCDKDISSFMANRGARSAAGSRRIHSLSDGIYIASIITKAPVQYIRFHADGIEINSPMNITAIAPEVIVKAADRVRMETPRLEVTGEIKDRCDGDGKTMEEMRETYNQHTHPGDSGGTTGTPNQGM